MVQYLLNFNTSNQTGTYLLRVANCEAAYAAYPNGVLINVLLYKQKLRNG
jgi:hypothetical protein